MRKKFTAEQIAERTAAGLASMSADPKSTKRPNQHLQPQRRPGRILKGVTHRGLSPLSSDSLAAYTYDGTALRRKAKPDRRKKNRRAVRAGMKPYRRPGAIGPRIATPRTSRRPDPRDAEAERQSAVKAALRARFTTRPAQIFRRDRLAISAKVGMSLGAVQNAINALQAKPLTRDSRKGAINLPRRKRAWLRAEGLKKRHAEEIKGWPKSKALPRRLQRIVTQRRGLREARRA